MKESTRARVAAIVIAASKGKDVSTVYDYSASGHKKTSVSVKNGQVSGYDHSTSTHFSGDGSGSLDFYDYETSKHVQLTLKGNNFEGYDYHSGKHFSGTVKDGSVSLYDHETGQNYNYGA